MTLNMMWVMQQALRMPRVAAIEHPFGRPYGEVDDAETQTAVLRAGLDLFATAREPGHVEHLPFLWHEDPKKTRWHPPKPAPIIRYMKENGLI